MTFSATLFAVEPPAKAENTPAHPPVHQKEKMAHEQDRPLPPKKDQHQNVLLDVTIKSDNPTEALKNITPLIPAAEGKAKQYDVHVSITELPKPKDEGEKPAPEENKPPK